MDGWMDGGVVVTLQGGGDGVGQFEVASDPGADPGAVQGASTFMRPERTASLRTHSTDEKHMRTQVCESHLRESEGESRCLTNTTLNLCHVTHHEAAVLRVGGQRHPQPHLVFPL